MNDKFGKEIKIGDSILRAVMIGRSPRIELRTVREIRDNKIYLDDSHVGIQFPNRLVIFNK